VQTTKACKEIPKHAETCTQHISNGRNVSDKREDELDCNEGEFYDMCGNKRKITACGIQTLEPKCDLEADSVACEACKASGQNRSMFPNMSWATCNSVDGYGGRLCQSCMTGFARDPTDHLKCKKCPENGFSYAFIVGGVLVATAALSTFIHMNMNGAGSSHVSGATQKILLNYLQTVSIASGFPLKWPRAITTMFAIQSSASSFSEQLMNFDCEMAKEQAGARVFWQKQVFFASLPGVLLIVNALFWSFRGTLCPKKKKGKGHRSAKKRQSMKSFKLKAQKALATKKSMDENASILDKLKLAHINKQSEKMIAYKNAVEARGDGTAVILTREFMRFVHEHEKLDTASLIQACSKKSEDEDGLRQAYMSRQDFLTFAKTHDAPFNETEMAKICDLLDPKFTDKITMRELISFYRSKTDKIILSSTIIMFILYPTICAQIFKLLACQPYVDPSDGDGVPSKQSYLLHDMELPCYDTLHSAFLVTVGFPSIIVWIIGFPLVSIFVLFWHKGQWTDRSLYRYAMFLNGYKPEHFFWECIIAIRKATLTFVSVYFAHMGVMAQAYAGIFVLFVFLCAHVGAQPFANTALNKLESSALGVSFLTMYLGLLFFMGWIQEMPGFSVSLSVIIILMNVLFLLWAIRLIIGKLYYQVIWAVCGRKCARRFSSDTGGDNKRNTAVSPMTDRESGVDLADNSQGGSEKASEKRESGVAEAWRLPGDLATEDPNKKPPERVRTKKERAFSFSKMEGE
jgi:hypothetical protein